MSGTVAKRKRLLHVSPSDCKNHTLDVGDHFDFFPVSSRSGGDGTAVTVELSGLDRAVETGVAVDRRTGAPRRALRGRAWVRDFFGKHDIQPGDVLALERTGEREYRLYPFETKRDRCDSWRSLPPLAGSASAPTVLELFAGCGGMALGFKRAGFRTALCNEWDAAACESIRSNITDRVAQCAIQEIAEFPKADVIAGGPPCQGFSNLGERVPNDPRNQLWRQYVRAVQNVMPKVFVLENVPPILRSQEYAELTSILEHTGYNIEGRVLNAADYGVPQTRKRAIVIGVLDGVPQFPQPTHADFTRKVKPDAALKPWASVRDAIADLPATPTEKNWHIGRNPTAMSLERYRCIPAGGNRWDLPPHLTPECWKRKTKGGTDLFGRLWWDRPSVTIRCEFYKPEKGRYLHPEADHPITHREAARLQGFPDDFDFQGKRIEVGIQIGNAVPPPFAEAIGRSLLKNYFASATRAKKRGAGRSLAPRRTCTKVG